MQHMPMLKEGHDAHVFLADYKNVLEQKVTLSILSWSSTNMKRVLGSSLTAEISSKATCMEQLDWMGTLWSRSRMTTTAFSLDDYEGALKKRPALLVTEDASHKERAANNGQATCDSARHCQVTTNGSEVDRRTTLDCRLSHQARNEEV